MKYHIENHPICPICGKPTIYKSKTSFTEYCSHECAYKSENVKNKKRVTYIKHYGVDHPMKCQKIVNKVKLTNIENYGVPSYCQSKEYKTWYKGNKEVMISHYKQTCLNKYGVDNFQKSKEYKTKQDEIINKRRQTNFERYGETSYSKTTEWKEIFHSKKESMLEKMKNTCKRKYGREWYFQTEDSKNKNYITQKKNGTFGKSKPEIELFKYLKNIYPNIIYQYKSKEYPWKCDYFIPEYKIYIELQGSWFHGEIPYNENNQECVDLVNLWRSKPNGFYKRAIVCYTIKDVEKRNKAKENKLKYIEIFDYSNFENIKNKINEFIIKDIQYMII